MEESILTSTKKVLGIDENYTAFDLDIATHINSALAVVNQLGVGPLEGLAITDASATWSDLSLETSQLGLVKSYLYLKVRLMFDPPSTSFHIEAINNLVREYEWRMNSRREVDIAEAEAEAEAAVVVVTEDW